MKVGHIRIDGSVAAEHRMQLVQRFQNDAKTRVAVLSMGAAGTGYTLTVGHCGVKCNLGFAWLRTVCD